jgi:hypothetical protein
MALIRTIGTGGLHITLGSLDEDYTYLTDFPDYETGMRIQSIEFVPSGIDDSCQIKDGGTTGPVIFNSASPNRFPIKYYQGAKMKPYYDISDTSNTCTASANAKIIIHLGGYSL